MQSWEKLRLDYEQTRAYFHALEEIRFKLLALVPVVTGVAFAAIDPGVAPPRGVILGLFGFLATLGIVIYEKRNTQIYDEMQIRAKTLEALLGLPAAGNRQQFKRGGPLLNRPPRGLKLLGLVTVWHDLGLALVYATTLAAWSYLIVAGATAQTGIFSVALRSIILVVVWLAFMYDFLRHDRPTDERAALPDEVRDLLEKPPD
jgi:hypothetical protein